MILLLLAGVCVFAHAHNDETQTAPSGFDCEHPPGDAIQELPGLLGTVGRLACLPAGPGILANNGWSWHYSGSFFNVPMIVAYAHSDSAAKLPPFYFTKLSARELTAGEATVRSEELQKEVDTYRPKGTVEQMTVVDATNNYGHTINVFLAMESQEKGWLLVCTPRCELDYVIVIDKLQPN
jgi:hypothetical protein